VVVQFEFFHNRIAFFEYVISKGVSEPAFLPAGE
jgi:hypothetical protein